MCFLLIFDTIFSWLCSYSVYWLCYTIGWCDSEQDDCDIDDYVNKIIVSSANLSIDSRLKDLIGDVTHHALVSLRCELLRDAADIAAPCNCQSLIVYDLLCCYQLDGLKSVTLSDIPTRWWFKTPQDFRDEIDLISKNETGKFVLMQKPWMKHISKLEKVFRSFNHDYKKTVQLMSALDKILQITDFDSTNMAEISLSLPGNNDVSPPGRPRKLIRPSSFKKDFVRKPAFRRNRLVYGKHKALKMTAKKISCGCKE
ncbi:hypothetical protein BDF21DRAFT_398888 [Thamnidium elegans]|nr:hypothetical protein BDF21DRAFT_398888 [Thamnidium elegans]